MCHMFTPPSEKVQTPQWPSHSLPPGFLCVCVSPPFSSPSLFFGVAYITEGRQSLRILPLAKYYEQHYVKSNYRIHTMTFVIIRKFAKYRVCLRFCLLLLFN